MRICIAASLAAIFVSSAVAAQSDGDDEVQGAQSPTPASDPGTWVTSDDYPAWAERNGVDGLVGVTLTVSPEGRVSKCNVSRSSQIADLDRIACEKIVERARFRPATDDGGSPVVGTFKTGVRFVMDGGSALPPLGTIILEYTVSEEGTVVDCRVQASIQSNLCEQAPTFTPPVDSDGKPEKRRYRITWTTQQLPLE